MKLLIIFQRTFSLLALLTLAFQQVGNAQANQSSPSSSSLLWKVEGKGIDQPSYLFGTLHVKCPEDLTISSEVKEALAETQQVVMELDMDDPAFMTNMQRLSVNEGMKNISSELSEEESESLNAFFQKHYGMDLSQLGYLKPFVLLSMVFAKGVDCPAPGSYENALMELVKEEGEEVKGLEELEDQFAIFDQVPVREQLEWVLQYATSEKLLRESIGTIISAYDSQDIEAIVGASDNFPEYKELMDDLLFDRNIKWIKQIEQYLLEKPTFFAVGAAHLGSDQGVVQLLRNAGYTVTPIQNGIQ